VSARTWLKKDWPLGLALSLLALVLFFAEAELTAPLEGAVYDFSLARSERMPSDRIAVIAIDDTSIANLGRWPWPRDTHAKLIDFLADAKAKVITHLAFFSEAEQDRGMPFIERIGREHAALLEATQDPAEPRPAGLADPFARIGAILGEASVALDGDRKLASSFAAAGNVVLPMLFRIDANQPVGSPDKVLPPYVAASTIKPAGGVPKVRDLPLPGAEVVSIPIERLGTTLAGVGHLHSNADPDGVFRSEPLIVDYFGYLMPSLAATVAARSLNLTPAEIRLFFGQGVSFGNLAIETGPHVSMRTHYYQSRGGRPAFAVDSFYDVVSGKVSPDKYRDRIVLIGPTAAGIAAPQSTPIGAVTPPVLVLANNVSSILQRHFVVAPAWSDLATLGAWLVVALYLVALLPRLQAIAGASVSAALLATLLAVPYLALTRSGLWLQLMLPAALLVAGHLLLTTKRFFVAESGKARADADSAESNRMLGLAMQGQGQLDAAFESFRRVPMSAALMDTLYGLALDYERKRQFNKAEAVFRYMSDFDAGFRDLKDRLARARQLAETVILGGARPTGGGATLLSADGIEKPMLGRYRVEKELGRGAMGTVYLGLDPKIGRQVAIKTMALGQEFEGDDLDEARERFFREAETAGRLNHPHIVTIFDAGEEHDLAYIAMEFLKGRNLTEQARPGSLLPFDRLVSLIARVAEALDYAHSHNVVHRDIKPENIMYDHETDTVKVTDFGIARITDKSKTRTGMVLGTPSYMSPEQLNGERIDGRSDLYSLAVTLYVMACGRLPFDGDSMATLMFRIANDAPPDIRTFAPAVPAPVATFLERALAKSPLERPQTGAQFADELRIAARQGAPRSEPAEAL